MNLLLQAYSDQAERLNYEVRELQSRVNEALKGKRITVTDEYFNGQPIGSSWPKLCGKTFEIDHAMISDGKIFVWFDGPNHYCYMPLNYGVIK